MVAVTIRADFSLSGAGKKNLVLFRVDFVFGVTGHAGRVNLCPWVHNIGRRATAARGPGFIGNMGVTFAVAILAADVRSGMTGGKGLVHVVNVANEAATVICSRPGIWRIINQ
jgi:hypothetical protein